ncbi:anti-sigma factor [Nonlabens xiamenensis]|uniref:anti-sigma factor n=1 Tax=Nonlabens xiamenensis TaxID=2341043 RepID=UPI000F6131DC|nr:anti-sigma factor [Nonlabens xiamenensis]
MTEQQNIQEFLDSGLLEQYVIGATTVAESQQVEHMIADHEEIDFAYQKLQEELYTYSQLHSVEPPEDVKAEMTARYLDQKVHKSAQGSANRWNIAAILIALIGLAGVWYSQTQVQDLQQEVTSARKNNTQLNNQINELENKQTELETSMAFLRSPQTQKYVLEGNQRAKGLQVMAFYNPTQEKARLEIDKLAQLDQDHDFQLWADVEGEMISLAVIQNVQSVELDPKILQQAASLNITIEKAGGSDHATVENLVAAVPVLVRS